MLRTWTLLLAVCFSAHAVRADEPKKPLPDPKPSLDEAFREWHKGLTSAKEEDRVKALNSMLPTKKDIEALFPKQAEKAWPLIEMMNKHWLEHIDDVAKDMARQGEIKKITAIDMRKDKGGIADSYRRLLVTVPETVGVYEIRIEHEGGSGRGGTYLYHSGRWFWIRDCDTIPEELDKKK
jgi:hypothetical protein